MIRTRRNLPSLSPAEKIYYGYEVLCLRAWKRKWRRGYCEKRIEPLFGEELSKEYVARYQDAVEKKFKKELEEGLKLEFEGKHGAGLAFVLELLTKRFEALSTDMTKREQAATKRELRDLAQRIIRCSAIDEAKRKKRQ